MSQARAAAIFGCAGTALDAAERAFFREVRPLGLILFARNIETPDQVRALTAAFRETVTDPHAPVLIDQEGGRVARLRPPHWPDFPPAAAFGERARRDAIAASEAVRLNSLLIARELVALGIDVDCLPVLDLRHAGADAVIGDRAYSDDPELVGRLGRAAAEGLMEAGVTPVVKHLPGHGRATADSHHALPVVDTDLTTLLASDFRPFASNADLPWGMTAHVVYAAVDPDAPATTSARVIGEVIRDRLGFDGLLLSDDISMRALSGGFAERAAAARAAGCDVVLHCNGEMDEMTAVAAGCGAFDAEGRRRLAAGRRRLGLVRRRGAGTDDAELAARRDALLAA
jgi:beta-N-acetylhexosaminidase